MNITELKARLRAHPEWNVSILLPDGVRVPAHYHVTEVGHVVRKFVDCGGTFRTSEACVLQIWLNSLRDDGHRLTAGRLAKILELANPILPAGELPVELEYEDGLMSQFPLMKASGEGRAFTLQLGLKHTDCLARAKCGVGESKAASCGEGDASESRCPGAGGPGENLGCCS